MAGARPLGRRTPAVGHRDQQLGTALPGRDDQARRQARIANGKDPDDLGDVDRGGPTRPRKLKPIESPPNPCLPPAPLGLADAASWLGIRAVQLALAVREAKVATVHGRGGELLVAHAGARVPRPSDPAPSQSSVAWGIVSPHHGRAA